MDMDSPPCVDDSSGSSLRCTQCTEVFNDVLALLSHLDSHASRCSICNKQFTSKQFLDHHMKSHSQSAGADTAGADTAGADTATSNSAQLKENVMEHQKENLEATTGPKKVLTVDNKKVCVDENIENDNSEMVPGQDEVNDGGKDTPVCEGLPSGVSEATSNEGTTKESGMQQDQSEEVEMKENQNANISKEDTQEISKTVIEEIKKPKIKPYKCSNCKYTANCVAIVNMHQRRQHPGEWTLVISTVDNTEIKQKHDVLDNNAKNTSGVNDDDDDSENGSEDEEVRKALQVPLPASDSDEEEVKDYRCSMCEFTATDTNTVFEHQQDKHPGEWQLTLGIGSPEHKEGLVGVGCEEEMESSAIPFYELPTELDHFSSMGRSIIAGNMGTEEQSNSQVYDNQEYTNVMGRFHCSNCPAYFYEQGHIRRHLLTCRATDHIRAPSAVNYRCRLCKRVFHDMNTLLAHMLNHQKNYACYRCTVCGYKGKFEGTIIAHMHHRHSQVPDARIEQIASQEDIEKIPTWWDSLGPMHDTRDGVEVIGDAGLDDPDLQHLFAVGMSTHSRDSTPQGSSPPESIPDMDTQSQCSELSDETIFDPNQWSLEAINNLKTGNNYMCPECPVLFREPYKLKRHLETHAGFKRHVCKTCGKRFTRSEHLKRHRVVHANSKPYMCNICCYSSKRLDNLQKHQRVKHPGEACEVVRISKEMIEAEIAANERAQPLMPLIIPRPQLAVLPQPSQSLIVPQTKAKRGRPRKISSPEDNFLFSRDPNYVTPIANMATPTHMGNNFLDINQQCSSDIRMNSTTGVMNQNYDPNCSNSIFNYNSPQPSTSFYPPPMFGSPTLSSRPLQMPAFDLSSISAAAASAVMAPHLNNQNIMGIDQSESNKDMSNLAENSSMASTTDANYQKTQPISNNVSSYEAESNNISGGALVNRGRYQCHVCDRPFSYLKPFKKHLLCHGTFMPYECSVCKHQTKRRDMMQDHQREAHQGIPCEIHVKEPTSDMHDMMDTYIQQVPEQRQNLPDSPALSAMSPAMQVGRLRVPNSSQIFPGTPGNLITAMDRSRVDPQVTPSLPLDLVKVEPLDSIPISVLNHTAHAESNSDPLDTKVSPIKSQSKFPHASSDISTPSLPKAPTQSASQNQKSKLASKGLGKSERKNSSPVIFSTFSPQTPTSGAGLVRPRPRRANLIKFKVLSSHTKAASKLQDSANADDETDNELPKPEEPLSMVESSSTSMKHKLIKESENEEEPKKCNVDPIDDVPLPKRRRLSERRITHTLMSDMKKEKEGTSAEKAGRSKNVPMIIGTAPKVPIMALKPGKTMTLSPAVHKTLVIDIKSHKGSPKEKQGDNHRFVCSVCDQRFAYEKPFKRHLLVHGGFEPYKCNACGQHTISRDSMKVHQHKVHPNQKGLGITVLDPTPEMEESLIEQGLLHNPADVHSDDEDNPANKSIVETARMEQHKMAAAMKTLSSNGKKKASENISEDGKEEEQKSFPLMLGLRPANSNATKTEENKTNEAEDGKNIKDESTDKEEEVKVSQVDINDLPVDDALFDTHPNFDIFSDTRPDGPYPCQYCDKMFTCTTKLQRHVVTHTGIKAYECQICFKKLTRLEHLKRHLLTHGNLKPYRCSLCKFDAKRLDIVQLHQRMAHLGEEVDIVYLFTPSVMLPDSEIGSDDGSNEKGRHGCLTCGLMFVTVSHLTAHQKTHINQKPYECFICNKTFTRPEHLKRHRLVHDDTKPYRCSECGFKTKRLDGMREHQRSRHPTLTDAFIIDTTLPEKPTVKRKRGRPPKFGPRDSLDGLQLLHCDKCCLAFYDQSRFDQHKITHIPSPMKAQDLTCQICGIRVSQAKHLRRHMLLHENHIPYQCSLCGYTAKRTDHMQLHFRKQHPEGGARMIHIAKDGSCTDASTSYMLSDDSTNDGTLSYGNDSYFDNYSVDEMTETSLTLEQLNEMAEVSDDEEEEEEEEEEMQSDDGAVDKNIEQESLVKEPKTDCSTDLLEVNCSANGDVAHKKNKSQKKANSSPEFVSQINKVDAMDETCPVMVEDHIPEAKGNDTLSKVDEHSEGECLGEKEDVVDKKNGDLVQEEMQSEDAAK